MPCTCSVCPSLAVAPCWAAAQTLPAGYAGSDTCKVCHEDIYNGVRKEPAPRRGRGRQARMGGPRLRGLPRSRPEAHRIGPLGLQHPQPGESRARGGRSNLSHLSSESADAGRAAGKQPRPQSDCLHRLPQSARQRAAGGSQGRGNQQAVRKLPSERVGPVPAAVSITSFPKAT